MHCTTHCEGSEVDGDQSRAVNQLDHQLFGFGVVARCKGLRELKITSHKLTSRYLSARCPTVLSPNRRPIGHFAWCPSQAEKIPHRTEPNTQQDQRNDLQFESLDQEKRQHHPAQGEWIDSLVTHNFC
jgi:hypothetical protein